MDDQPRAGLGCDMIVLESFEFKSGNARVNGARYLLINRGYYWFSETKGRVLYFYFQQFEAPGVGGGHKGPTHPASPPSPAHRRHLPQGRPS